jgi:hypothetical protein
MKKIMKSFMAMALGLSLVLSGCSKDDDDNKAPEINFVGDYTITATVAGAPVAVPPISATLQLTKEGTGYRASAQLSQFGSLSLLLTEVTKTVDTGSAVAYSFVVAEQTLTILTLPMPVSGTGTLGAVTVSSATAYTIEMSLAVEESDITVTIAGTK